MLKNPINYLAHFIICRPLCREIRLQRRHLRLELSVVPLELRNAPCFFFGIAPSLLKGALADVLCLLTGAPSTAVGRESRDDVGGVARSVSDLDVTEAAMAVSRASLATLRRLFRKTHFERISWSHMFLTYRRIVTLQALVLHVMIAISFHAPDGAVPQLRACATVVVTDACSYGIANSCKLCERCKGQR